MKMASRLIDLISKKQIACAAHFFKQICTCRTLFVFPLPLFCTTTTLFCTTKTSNFLVTHYFYGGIVVCAYPIFCFLCSCLLLFFTGPHLHLAGRSSLLASSISHFLTDSLNFSCSSSYQICLPRSSSFSDIHVSVNIK